LIDISGKRVGTFVVVRYAGIGTKAWECRCDCGFERTIEGHYLRKEGINPLCQNCSSSVIGRQIRERTLVDRDCRAYLAGIIDGEGCISVGWRKGKYITPTLQITNTNKDLMEWLVRTCGGTNYRKGADGRSTRKQCWYWIAAGRVARDIIEAVRPYLIVKNKQADLILFHYENAPQRPTKRNSLGRLTRVLSDEELHLNGELVAKIRELNRRGAPCH
jgi:hypothetical protein